MTVDEAGERRRKAERFGHLAEHAAAWLLRFKGYRIIARRERTPHGEIDLIAARGRVIAFVEVKARSSHDEALEAITPRQAKRIVVDLLTHSSTRSQSHIQVRAASAKLNCRTTR